jgi:hypothetical protein
LFKVRRRFLNRAAALSLKTHRHYNKAPKSQSLMLGLWLF